MAKKKLPSGKAVTLGAAKLKSSGLDPASYKELGLEFLDNVQTGKLHKAFKPVCSLKIKYYDHEGKPMVDMPRSKPFYRLRYLEMPTDFSAMTEKKQTRYVQEPNTAPVAYFPLNHKWSDLVKDPSQPLIITEGELKAIKACQEGFPTIGIGGVYNWRSRKLGIEWLPSLQAITWPKRNVYICFDSDYTTNINVCVALQEFADELTNHGAFVHVITLPSLPDHEKVGLDDFFVSAGGDVKKNFSWMLHYAEPIGMAKPLWQLNNEWVYVRNPGVMVNRQTRDKCNPAAFRDHVASTSSYQEQEIKKDGELSYKAVAATAAWLRWPLRQEAGALTYEPGASEFVQDKRPTRYNIWTGWGVQPKKGDIKPFLQLVDHLFQGAEPEAKDWFLKWCAYPLQNPGTKMFSSVLLHGVKHGTGKSFIGYTLGKIYGDNFSEINQTDLHNHFNEWCEGKQFVMGDDVTGSNKRADADFLKKLITQKNIRVNGKYVPTYVVPDLINYFFTANHPDAFFLEDDDRRHFIHEVTVGPLSEEFYMEYELWYDGFGPAHLFDYLLKLDLSDFNPAAPAFKTMAKSRMISNVQSDLATWVRTLIVNPEHILKVGEMKIKKDLFSSKELLQLYNPAGGGNITANGIGRELSRAGVHQVAKGYSLKTADGNQTTYYAVRNTDVWLQASPSACVKHLNDWQAKQSAPQKKY